MQIWRLIALNPRLTYEDRDNIYKKLCSWHLTIIERICKQKTNGNNISSGGHGVFTSPTLHSNNDRTFQQKRRDVDIFPGFLPSIELCQIDWSKCEYYPESETNFETSSWSEYIQQYDETLLKGYYKLSNPSTSNNLNINLAPYFSVPARTIVSESSNVSNEDASPRYQREDKSQEKENLQENIDELNPELSGSSNANEECSIYFPDSQSANSMTNNSNNHGSTTTSSEPYVFRIIKPILDPLQVTFKKQLLSTIVLLIYFFF